LLRGAAPLAGIERAFGAENKGKGKCEYRDLSTAAQKRAFGRDDNSCGVVKESGRAELDTPPFTKGAKGGAPGVGVVLGDVLLHEFQGAGVGKFCGLSYITRAGGVGEGVAGTFVDVDFYLGMGVADCFDLVGADVVVVGSEVQHYRADGGFGGYLADAAGVVADGAGGLHL